MWGAGPGRRADREFTIITTATRIMPSIIITGHTGRDRCDELLVLWAGPLLTSQMAGPQAPGRELREAPMIPGESPASLA